MDEDPHFEYDQLICVETKKSELKNFHIRINGFNMYIVNTGRNPRKILLCFVNITHLRVIKEKDYFPIFIKFSYSSYTYKIKLIFYRVEKAKEFFELAIKKLKYIKGNNPSLFNPTVYNGTELVNIDYHFKISQILKIYNHYRILCDSIGLDKDFIHKQLFLKNFGEKIVINDLFKEKKTDIMNKISVLIDILSNYPKICRKVKLEKMNTNEAMFFRHISKLLLNNKIRNLKIKNFKIKTDSAGTALMLIVAKPHPCLTSLSIKNVSLFSPKAVVNIASSIKNAPLQKLTLSNIGLAEKACELFSKSLCSSGMDKTLKVLDLSYNIFCQSETNFLCNFLIKCTRLKKLDISYSKLNVSQIMASINSNDKIRFSTLKFLSFSGCNINDLAKQEIIRFLQNIESDIYLDLSYTNITQKTFAEIMSSICDHKLAKYPPNYKPSKKIKKMSQKKSIEKPLSDDLNNIMQSSLVRNNSIDMQFNNVNTIDQNFENCIFNEENELNVQNNKNELIKENDRKDQLKPIKPIEIRKSVFEDLSENDSTILSDLNKNMLQMIESDITNFIENSDFDSFLEESGDEETEFMNEDDLEKELWPQEENSSEEYSESLEHLTLPNFLQKNGNERIILIKSMSEIDEIKSEEQKFMYRKGHSVRISLNFSGINLRGIEPGFVNKKCRIIEYLNLSDTKLIESDIENIYPDFRNLPWLYGLVLDRNFHHPSRNKGRSFNPKNFNLKKKEKLKTKNELILGNVVKKLVVHCPRIHFLSLNAVGQNFKAKNSLNIFFPYLSINRSLNRLDIANNDLSNEAISLLEDALKKNFCLKYLNTKNCSDKNNLMKLRHLMVNSPNILGSFEDFFENKNILFDLKIDLSRSIFGKNTFKTPLENIFDVKYTKKMSGIQFGINIVDIVGKTELIDSEFPIPTALIKLEKNLEQINGYKFEGIFRKNANFDALKSLEKIYNHFGFKFSQNAYVVTELIKVWFRSLPEPILNPLIKTINKTNISSFTKIDKQHYVSKIISLLGLPEKSTFIWLLKLLRKVDSYSEFNKMTAKNLAIVFLPNLMKTGEMNLNPNSLYFLEAAITHEIIPLF